MCDRRLCSRPIDRQGRNRSAFLCRLGKYVGGRAWWICRRGRRGRGYAHVGGSLCRRVNILTGNYLDGCQSTPSWNLKACEIRGRRESDVPPRSEEKDHPTTHVSYPFPVAYDFRSTYTSACGNRTLLPYTMPFLTPFTSVRMSWYLGSNTIFSSAAC